MKRKLAIIGIGSLGGFVSHAISEIENIEKVTLVDFDKVEEKNLTNSIYKKSDIGKYKTTALHDIIKEQSNVNIEIMTTKYIDNETIIPDVDFVIDCRDVICNRKNIDIKLSISSRYLIIDCRRYAYYEKNYDGKYLTQLTKIDLRKAAINVSALIQNGFIDQMIERDMIREIDLDYLDKVVFDPRYKDLDMIIDYDASKKLLNLEENIKTIFDENKNKDVIIMSNVDKSPMKIIPKGSINNVSNLIKIIGQVTENQNSKDSQYYILSTNIKQDVCYLELLKETGAA